MTTRITVKDDSAPVVFTNTLNPFNHGKLTIGMINFELFNYYIKL